MFGPTALSCGIRASPCITVRNTATPQYRNTGFQPYAATVISRPNLAFAGCCQVFGDGG